ncbi:Zinc finger C2H2 [Penicillium alfredii]|uniref:Zinc finger C2H2 n=1 Tax=Penicillium alfredii TaxID=1506179 RepID=A0A9W9GBC0_9EURO|nr:Zinc finger C2H2 [Penicillium alfredii]KAJ5114890.1 Zinc finger C2H2 [Penicillium alfredii]
MTAVQVEPSRLHPRRRPVLNTTLPPLPTDSSASDSSAMRLRKGETFHTPTSPPSGDADPVLDVRSLPRRSPTCPKTLEAIAASEERMTSILGRLTLDSPDESDSSSKEEDLPLPRGFLESRMDSKPSSRRSSQSSNAEGRDLPVSPRDKKSRQNHGHGSDSGLGTSISSDEAVSESGESEGTVNDGIEEQQSAITNSISAFESGSSPKRQLGLNACKQIERFILVPILKESRLKPFHTLVESVPQRILNKQIVCLRDLEKTLLWLAPKFSVSRRAYLSFCEFTIQCLHTSASHLNERDQRLPADRPYTNGYFLDLVSQVRRYAAMMHASRQRVQAAQDAKSKDKSMLVGAELKGGLSVNGKPAELVVMHEGKPISMRTGLPYEADVGGPVKRTISFDDAVDEGVQRSMARRKKNAPPMDINQKCSHCDKVFKRPCDLTKHEKTHSRPWKCTLSSCKYFQVGWPTEKERDRHMNDKHSDTPALFKCSFKPCTYASKRESNCKQHMEKAHGWVYVRSKNNARGGSKRGSSLQATPQTPSVSTPASKPVDFPTPITGPSPSPSDHATGLPENPPFNFADPPALARSDDFPLFFDNSPYPTSSAGFTNDVSSFPTSVNLDAFQAQFEAADPNGLIPALEMHRQSMNSMSVPSAESVPDLMGPSMSFDGSPLATADNTSLNFDLEWSQLDMQTMNDDYTAMHMQLPTPHSDPQMMKSYSHEAPRLAAHHFPLPYDATDAAGKLSGLSPGAQGNVTLYSPASGQADEGLSDHYVYSMQPQAGDDFTLYEQNPQAGQRAATMAPTNHHAGQYNQPMFPPLAERVEREHILHGIQSWAEQQHGAPHGAYLPSDMDLEFMK